MISMNTSPYVYNINSNPSPYGGHMGVCIMGPAHVRNSRVTMPRVRKMVAYAFNVGRKDCACMQTYICNQKKSNTVNTFLFDETATHHLPNSQTLPEQIAARLQLTLYVSEKQ